jgi:hypothetical protein
MNDSQLTDSLQSIGMGCFVKYFEAFSNDRVGDEELTKALIQIEFYTENSARTKVSQARRIIREGCTQEALEKVMNSKKTESWVVEKARCLVAMS